MAPIVPLLASAPDGGTSGSDGGASGSSAANAQFTAGSWNPAEPEAPAPPRFSSPTMLPLRSTTLLW
ncbi:hypothetical protein ACIBCA_27435 [Kitasatospora sp. NPDC051170]|uniref:hypothetical protein n=1 Tax=Kitasatospora sp. NPDC051170 TaxID=3364056 RepID=UPI0037BCDFD7